MKKEVMVSIKGLQSIGEETNEPVELISCGTYQFLENRHMVQYEEVDEEVQEITKVTVVIEPEYVEIIKHGQNNVQMVFQKNQKTTSCYQTPFGELMIGMDTTSIQVTEEEDVIEVELEYGLDMNCNHIADCKINMKIASKDVK